MAAVEVVEVEKETVVVRTGKELLVDTVAVGCEVAEPVEADEEREDTAVAVEASVEAAEEDNREEDGQSQKEGSQNQCCLWTGQPR